MTYRQDYVDLIVSEFVLLLLFSHPNLWQNFQVTEESFIDGGFFRTGDAARVDEDGYYIILGRKHLLILWCSFVCRLLLLASYCSSSKTISDS